MQIIRFKIDVPIYKALGLHIKIIEYRLFEKCI